MKIERIEIAGFKSFADPVTLEFEGGATAIVGPNGCGKSNIADAVFWVLGELGAATIRARGKDLIFSGSGLRDPLGIAEVRMHLLGAPADLGGLAAWAPRPSAMRAAPAEPAPADGNGAVGSGLHGEAADGNDLHADGPDGNGTAGNGTDGNGAVPESADHGALGGDTGGGRAVIVSRRVDRTGTSTYRIDGRRARRRDVQRLFAAAGLGPGSYALIEQGRANEVISRRPEELRILVEEAAGLGAYRLNRQESEANLRAAEKALDRVRDRLAELDRSIRQARRDARAARRARKTGERIALLRVAEQAARRESLTARLRQGRAPEIALEAERDRRAASLEVFDRFLSGLRGERDENAETLREATRRLGDAHGDEARAEAVLTEGERSASGRAARRPRLAAEERELTARMETRRKEGARLTERAETFPALLERLGGELETRTEDRDRLRTEEREGAAEAATARRDRERLEASVSARQLAQNHHEAQRERLSAARQELAGSARELEAQAVAAARQVEAAEAEEAEQQAEGERRRGESREADAARARAVAEQRNARRLETEARQELEGVRARLASVRALVLSREQLGPTAARLLRLAPERDLPLLGAVGDGIEVETGFETAAERLVGVHRVRIERAADLFPVMESLGEGEAAPCEVLVSELVEAARGASAGSDEAEPAPDAFETHVRAEDPVVRAAIPAAEVAPDLRAALDRFRERPGLYVTLAGETVSPPGVVRFGRGGPGEGFLAARREAAELEAEESRTEVRRLAAAAALGVAAERAAAAETEREERREALAVAEAELGRRRLASERAREAQADLARRREQVAGETAAHAEEEERNEAEAARAVEELRRDREQREAAETRLAEAETRLTGVRERLEAAERAWQEADRELARQTAVADEVRREESSREQQAEHDSRRLAQIAEERAALVAEDEEWGTRKAAAVAGRRDAAARGREWEERERRLTAAGEALALRLRQAEDALRVRRTELEAVEQRLTAARSEIGEATTLLRELETEFERAAGRPLAEAAAGLPPDLGGRERDDLATELREQEAVLARLGPVNEIAEARLKELEAERDGPAAQLRDVEQGIEDGLKALERHDRDARRRFHEAFAAVDAGFDVAFRQLFGGGRAELCLTTPDPPKGAAADDPTEGAPDDTAAGNGNGNGADAAGEAPEDRPDFRPGVEMRAQPPGKKLQSLRLLSGGEKALTAIAFLIALFRYRPAPFCLLDEVDAPLDDANIARFSGLLAELKQDTQLVVITHNRQTMESCEHLYGVTMEEPGVSRLVSVEIGDEQIEGWLGERGAEPAAERAASPPPA